MSIWQEMRHAREARAAIRKEADRLYNAAWAAMLVVGIIMNLAGAAMLWNAS